MGKDTKLNLWRNRQTQRKKERKRKLSPLSTLYDNRLYLSIFVSKADKKLCLQYTGLTKPLTEEGQWGQLDQITTKQITMQMTLREQRDTASIGW